MFSQRFCGGLLVSALALTLGSGLTAAQQNAADAVGEAAAQLATRGDAFVASSAALEVLPIKMAGSCPRAFMLKVDLGAEAPGSLAYRIEALDGRVSQVFETQAKVDREGGYVARIEHEIALQKEPGGKDGARRLAFSAPTLPAGQPAAAPDFFERLFGTAAERDPAKGLSQQSFRVKVVAPNEVVSAFDRPSVSCEYTELVRVVDEGGPDGRDAPGRDPGGRDPGGAGGGGGGAAGAAGARN